MAKQKPPKQPQRTRTARCTVCHPPHDVAVDQILTGLKIGISQQLLLILSFLIYNPGVKNF